MGPYSYVRVWEDGESALGCKLALSTELGLSRIGYWNPFVVAGMDSMSNTFLFNIDSILFPLFPGWLAYGLIMWLQRFIAGYFTFRLLKDELNLDTASSMYAGLAYSLMPGVPPSGFPFYYGMCMPGVSFFIWALSRCEDRGTFSYLIAFIIGLLFSSTSYFSFALFTIPMIIFWFLLVVPRKNIKFWINIVLFICGFGIVQIPIIWAGALNVPLSQRAHWVITPYSIDLAMDIAWKHIIPLIIALLGAIVCQGRSRLLNTFIGAYAVCFIFLALYPILYNSIISHFILIRGFQFDRIYLMFPYLAFCSAAVGIHYLKDKPLKISRKSSEYNLTLYKVILVSAICLVLFQSLLMKTNTLQITLIGLNRWSTVFQNPTIKELANDTKEYPPYRVVTLGDDFPQQPSASMAYGLEAADGNVNVYSRRYQEYWEQVIWRLLKSEPNYGSFSSWGCRVYLFKGDYNINLLSLANVKYIFSRHPLQGDDLQLLHYGSTKRDEQIKWQEMNLRNKILYAVLHGYPDSPTFIYENQKVLPRFFIVDKIKLYKESNQLLSDMRTAEYMDLRQNAFLKQSDVSNIRMNQLSTEGGNVELRVYKADRIILTVTNHHNSILIITNNYSPFWKAKVDGIETKIFPVDHTFQGFCIEGGVHTVDLEYDPPYAIRF